VNIRFAKLSTGRQLYNETVISSIHSWSWTNTEERNCNPSRFQSISYRRRQRRASLSAASR